MNQKKEVQDALFFESITLYARGNIFPEHIQCKHLDTYRQIQQIHV